MADKQQNQLVLIHSNLEKMLKDKSKALPKNFNQTRFLQNAMVVLQDTKGIEKMQPVSVARTMLKGAFLGLDFFMKDCYAVPYGDQLNFQTDYKGEIKFVKEHSTKPINEIYAKVVREGDQFETYIKDGKATVNFREKPFNEGKILGAFAVCLFENNTLIYETMSTKGIEHIRQRFSKMPNGLMWKETPTEAYKKTVVRRLRKWIDIKFDSDDQAEAYQSGGDAEFINAEVVKPEPVRMPESIKKEGEFELEQQSYSSGIELHNRINELRVEKWAKIDKVFGERIDKWFSTAISAETPDDIDEEGGKAILEELEKL